MSAPRRRLLPEWHPQDGVLLTWPHSESDWRPALTAIEAVYLSLVKAITRFETALVVCRNATHLAHVRRQLEPAAIPPQRLILTVTPSNDTWTRDYGPITVLENGVPCLLDFVFNGWGGKFPADLDNDVTHKLHAAGMFGDVPLQHLDFVLEGGSIDSDGGGRILTTRACLLTPTRNAGLDAAAVEHQLRESLGIDEVLWLEHGYLAGDDTDSHIDMLARFCTPRTVAYTSCTDPGDEHFAELQAMEHQLQAMFSAADPAVELIPLPLPAPQFDADGGRRPASYVNFLILNGAVLVPAYGDPADLTAQERLQKCFPGRTLVNIDCRALIAQGGSLHCATMQLPGGVLGGD
ncbi:MAG: agmatine deiminase family protein [Pseudomonadota bacterium]|nr:MAG: agmatine deiminase family protein [Pseudomonadota bacterium]